MEVDEKEINIDCGKDELGSESHWILFLPEKIAEVDGLISENEFQRRK